MKIFLLLIESTAKGAIYGALPFLLFVLVTSQSSIVGGLRSFVVVTGSMEPTIPVGTIVFTKPFDVYRLNDVISFKKDAKTVTHRIVDIENQSNALNYKTMGDANNVTDNDVVTSSQIHGRVFFTLPYLGKTVLFIKTIPGYLLLIVVPAAIYIIFELIYINKEIKKEIEKKILQKISRV